MKVFRATDKQYNAEYHLYEMVEAIKKLSKDDLQEFANASPVFEDAVHLTNKLVKYQAEQFEALVQEVAPMQKLSFEVDLGAEAEDGKSKQAKPVFEEVKDFNNVPTKVVNYEHIYGLPVNIQAVIQRIDLDDCILIPLETFFELQKLLKGSKYYFFQSKNTVTNKVEIIIWKT